MESGDEELREKAGSDSLDYITAVAQANDLGTDLADAAYLPEVRSSPCHMHCRGALSFRQSPHQFHQSQRHDGRNDLLYSTNHHGGHIKRAASQVSRKSASSDHKEESRIELERDKTFHRDVLSGMCHTYVRPTLPKEMTSQDFISSWLLHGSEPQDHNHFPEVTTRKSRKDKSRPAMPAKKKMADKSLDKKTPLKPKQTLEPIRIPHAQLLVSRETGTTAYLTQSPGRRSREQTDQPE